VEDLRNQVYELFSGDDLATIEREANWDDPEFLNLIRDYIDQTKRANKLEELIMRVTISEQYPELLNIIKTQKEISDMEIPESEGLIDKGYKIGIIGEMQSGKSLLALRIGQDLVEGRPILDYFPWDRKWRVLYVNFELPEAEMIARFSFFGDNPNYVLLNLPIIDLENEDECSPIVNALKVYRESGKPFDALILDPKVNCFAGDENQTKDNLKWCAACDKLIREYNLCLIIPHHYGRNTGAKGGRGNTVFGGWLTKRLELKGADDRTEKTLSVHGKVGESLKLSLKLNYPVWEVGRATIEAKESKVSMAKTFIMNSIPEDRTVLVKAANLEGITQSIFKEAQNQLETEGLISVVQAAGQGNRKRLIPPL
jgi:hypothetical protein